MSDGSEAPVAALRDWSGVLRTHWRLIVSVAMVCAVVAVGVSLLVPTQYEATALVSVRISDPERVITRLPDNGYTSRQRVASELEILRGAALEGAVTRRVGHAVDLSADDIGNGDRIEPRARASTARRAVSDARAYTSVYVRMQRAALIRALRRSADALDAKIKKVQRRYDAQPAGPTARELRDQLQYLRAQRDLLVTQAVLAGPNGAVGVVVRAGIPDDPVQPTPVRAGVLAGLLGAAVGITTAFVVDGARRRRRRAPSGS